MLIAGHKNDPRHCIVTPQIVRLWDTTWDILVNEEYMDIPATHDNYFSFDGYDLYKNKDKDIFLTKNEQRFKFAAGWCTLFSSDLFKDYINLTYDFGHYGSADDTFIMNVLDYYKFTKNKNINQYMVQNVVVTENYNHNLNQYDNLVVKNANIKTKKEFNDDVNKFMEQELKILINGK